MPTIINKTTHEVLDVRDETLYDESEWLILSAAWLAEHGMPVFDRLMWRYSNGVVIEGEPIAPVESMADRHLREQREGVTLTNGWVMAYTREARDVMGDLKNLIDLAGPQLPGVSFWEVNGTNHDTTVNDGLAVMAEYAVKSSIEVLRQYAEVSGG